MLVARYGKGMVRLKREGDQVQGGEGISSSFVEV
jgi:hypothetical protein